VVGLGIGQVVGASLVLFLPCSIIHITLITELLSKLKAEKKSV